MYFNAELIYFLYSNFEDEEVLGQSDKDWKKRLEENCETVISKDLYLDYLCDESEKVTQQCLQYGCDVMWCFPICPH